MGFIWGHPAGVASRPEKFRPALRATAAVARRPARKYSCIMHNPPRYGRASKRVGELLDAGRSHLGKLIAHAREIDRLDRKLANLLEPAIAGQVRVAVRRGHSLVLLTPSAALATRLRLDSDQLAQSLRSAGEHWIGEIQVRVAPFAPAPAPQRPKRELPDAAKRALERFATDSGDADIAAIVQRGKRQEADE
jgi:hypothetical protein